MGFIGIASRDELNNQEPKPNQLANTSTIDSRGSNNHTENFGDGAFK